MSCSPLYGCAIGAVLIWVAGGCTAVAVLLIIAKKLLRADTSRRPRRPWF